jgi:hypothetical protein
MGRVDTHASIVLRQPGEVLDPGGVDYTRDFDQATHRIYPVVDRVWVADEREPPDVRLIRSNRCIGEIR